MHTRSQGPPESVVPSTRRLRRRRAAGVPESSDDKPERDGDPAGVSGPSSVVVPGRGRSCPPLRRPRVGRPAVRQQHSPAGAARQLFAPPGTVQPQGPVMAAAAAKYPKFQGKSDEDPDAHVRKFDKIYGLNNQPPVVQQHKESVLNLLCFSKLRRSIQDAEARKLQRRREARIIIFCYEIP